MQIRHAKDSDALAIAGFIQMAESEMVHIFTGTTDPEKQPSLLLPFVLSPAPSRYSLANNLVAEIDGAPAGSIIAFPADSQPELDAILLEALNKRGYNLEKLFFEGEPGTYYLSTMGVDPKFRGKGVGTALMAAAESEGGTRGFSQTSLLVSKGKDKARKLYERVGYRYIGDVTIGDVEYVRMVKDL